MTLVISTIAAVVFTFLWYRNSPENIYRYDIPSFMFWGASLMWFVDFVFELFEEGVEYFEISTADLISDTVLGIVIVTVAMVIWVVVLIAKDPKNVLFKKAVAKN